MFLTLSFSGKPFHKPVYSQLSSVMDIKSFLLDVRWFLGRRVPKPGDVRRCWWRWSSQLWQLPEPLINQNTAIQGESTQTFIKIGFTLFLLSWNSHKKASVGHILRNVDLMPKFIHWLSGSHLLQTIYSRT